MTVWRSLRIDRPSLFVERGVVVDVGFVGVQLRYVLGDKDAFRVVPGSRSNAIASIYSTRTVVLRYARHVRLPAPVAFASV